MAQVVGWSIGKQYAGRGNTVAVNRLFPIITVLISFIIAVFSFKKPGNQGIYTIDTIKNYAATVCFRLDLVVLLAD